MTAIKQAIAELRPCPFCGNHPNVREDTYKYHDEDVWIIECRFPTCPVMPEIENPNRLDALSAWNTRSSVEGGTVEECIDCKNLESTIDKLHQRLTTAIDDEATRIKRWAQASAIYRFDPERWAQASAIYHFDPERKAVVADGKQGNLIELQTVEQICEGTHGYSGKYEPEARPMWSPTPSLTSRIEAAAEEIRSVACIAWDELPDGHWLKDVDDKLTAIIRRHIEGGK